MRVNKSASTQRTRFFLSVGRPEAAASHRGDGSTPADAKLLSYLFFLVVWVELYTNGDFIFCCFFFFLPFRCLFYGGFAVSGEKLRQAKRLIGASLDSACGLAFRPLQQTSVSCFSSRSGKTSTPPPRMFACV